MKIAYETVLKSSMESLWEIVGDFSKYPEWNPVITSIEGETTPESILKITLKLSGSLPRHTQAIVTGFAKPKYFSFEIQHRFGAWFYHEECGSLCHRSRLAFPSFQNRGCFSPFAFQRG